MALEIAAFILISGSAFVVAQFLLNRKVVRMMEQVPPLNAVGVDSMPETEDFEVVTSDGLTLRGSVLLPPDQRPRALVVFFHELGGNRWSAARYSKGLLDSGYAIVAFDFRNHGESDAREDYEPLQWISEFELDDIRSVMNFIDNRPDLTELLIGSFGISRGGACALIAAAESTSMTGVACEAAYSTRSMMGEFARRWTPLLVPRLLLPFVPDWHIRFTLYCSRRCSELKRRVRYVHVEKFLPALANRNVLLISGEKDGYTLPVLSRSLHESIPSEQSELWIVPNARHNQARESSPQEYDVRLVEFFDRLVVSDEIELAEPFVSSDQTVEPAAESLPSR